MLNSMQLNSDHYSLKLKSMFDLAIASQRYTSFPSLLHNQQHLEQLPVNFSSSPQQRHQQNYAPPPFTEQNTPSQNKSQISRINLTSVNNPINSSTPMEGIRREDGHSMQMRPLPPEAGQKSTELLSVSPVTSVESTMTHVSYNNNNNNNIIGASLQTHSNQQPLNFVNPRGISSEIDGRQKGKKQGPSVGNKTSFSIESLLAHSNTWRRNHTQDFNAESGCGKSTSGKETRFIPYPLPHQTPQQNRTTARLNSVGGTNKASSTGDTSSENEKRTEVYGSGSGSKAGGNGRRSAKSKRVRTIFTPEQLERLEAEFERQQYMVGPERLYLASSLYLTEAQVKVWFQNRRIKWRKQHLEMEQQRLAIYRTLAEQDMMSSVDDEEQEEDSVDCDYVVDEGEYDETNGGREEDQTSLHSPAHQGISSQRLSIAVHPTLHPPYLHSHSSAEKPDPPHLQIHSSSAPSTLSSNQLKSIGSSTTCANKSAETKTRLQLQQVSNTEDYDTCSSSTSSASSPTSSSAMRGSVSSKSGNHGILQGGKK